MEGNIHSARVRLVQAVENLNLKFKDILLLVFLGYWFVLLN